METRERMMFLKDQKSSKHVAEELGLGDRDRVSGRGGV